LTVIITAENNMTQPESRFTTNKILLSHFRENYFGKLRFKAANEITIHEKRKQAISHFTGKKIRPFTNHENTVYHPHEWYSNFETCCTHHDQSKSPLIDLYLVFIVWKSESSKCLTLLTF